jgi:ABC-2 type transport system permease protein
MRKIWDIALNDLRIIFREKDIWINILVVPIILSFVIGYANGAGQQPGTPEAPDVIIDVIDGDASEVSTIFLQSLRAANPNFVLCPADNDADGRCELGGAPFDAALAEARLREQTALALIEIPAGFGATLSAGQNVEIVYRSNENASAPSFILQAVQATVQRMGASIVAERVGTTAALTAPGLTLDDAEQAALAGAIRQRADDLLGAQTTLVREVTSATAGTQTTPSSGGFSQSVPGMASMYVMFVVFPAAVAFMTERQQGTLQRLVTMPITRWQLLGGKLLARFLMGMLQYGIIFAFGYLVLGVRFGDDPLALLLTMVVFTLCITALTLALATLLRSEAQAGAITLLLTLTLAPLGGAWWPLEIVPDWMQTLGHVSPVAWAMDSYSSLIFFGGTLMNVLPYIGVLAAMAAIFFAFGVARFRIE